MISTDDDRGQDVEALLAEVRRIDVQSRRLVRGVMAGGYVSVFRGAGVEFDEVREYAEGDDPRSIDWNVTARMGRPYVKKLVEERERTVLFALDRSASMDAGFSTWSARQTAARVVACLALSAVRNGDKVGLVTSGDDGRPPGPSSASRTAHAPVLHVPARKGAGHALRVVRDCLALPSDAASLAPSLEFLSRAVRHGAVVFMLSDFLSDGWQRALALCARRHDVVAVRLMAPELDALPRSMLRVRDLETGAVAVLDGSNERVRTAYARRVALWRTRTEQDLLRCGVDRMDVPVPRVASRDAVAGPILRFFRMRELRGVKR